ncbi:MAG: hypothetical protein CFH19_01289 [Alphaproteobacteria bacterium MarineAlpha5_Bin9]|nr:MAG: hypothetical protein CFH19_01289 [Alphaproteobacteria bacterium MarineAlpha5_Bin9]|tara:strand:+ start:456 stop:893 length:438 start_codon:yes stop_codon:yes gene_type:complete
MNKLNKNEIRFKCQGSSNCCVSRGSYGFVYLSNIDLKRLSKYFNISKETFKKKYCNFTDGYLSLKEFKKNGDCQFLKRKRCSVYKARPIQCRTWPFWKENMNAKKWNKNIMSFCPGVGKGRKISKIQINKKIKMDIINEQNIIKL